VLPLKSQTPLLALSYVSMIGCAAAALLAAIRLGRDATDVSSALLGLCAAVSVACSFILSMSWVVWEPMVFPGLAILLTGALRPHRAPICYARHLMIALCLMAILLAGSRKFESPYTWGYWTEPSLAAERTSSRIPALAGLKLSRPTAEFLDSATDIIRTRSEPGDRIFVFPYYSVLYALGDRLPAVYARQHWFDVCPDAVAEEDARRLLASPPAVIVAMEFPEEVLAREEFIFRKGKKSGQRALIAAIDELTANYELAATHFSPGYRFPIKVWVRRPISPKK
jgi:hypothetical protein